MWRADLDIFRHTSQDVSIGGCVRLQLRERKRFQQGKTISKQLSHERKKRRSTGHKCRVIHWRVIPANSVLEQLCLLGDNYMSGT